MQVLFVVVSLLLMFALALCGPEIIGWLFNNSEAIYLWRS